MVKNESGTTRGPDQLLRAHKRATGENTGVKATPTQSGGDTHVGEANENPETTKAEQNRQPRHKAVRPHAPNQNATTKKQIAVVTSI